jgi:asparagine synthetase B (glutamine-hydrolysing)
MFRTIADTSKCFTYKYLPKLFDTNYQRKSVGNSLELNNFLHERVSIATKDGKAALALSGGIDSAILAKYMPKGSVAYTFKCIVPGNEVTDESTMAAQYAEACGLEHRIVEVYWEDIEKFLTILMKNKGSPLHSIEIQIYKASLQAKKDGFSKLIFGESADALYGGHDGLLSKNYNLEEITKRYSHVLPQTVLKEPNLILEPFLDYFDDNRSDIVGFVRDVYFKESMASYENACQAAEIEPIIPYSMTSPPELDLDRIRLGEPKYIVREVFKKLYPDFKINEKIPMPRPTNEWFKDWSGPARSEFIPNCQNTLTGDQKWLVYCLEKFLDMVDNSA